MKKIVYILSVVFLVSFFFSCNSKKTKDEQVKEFRGTLTQADTTAMLEVCNNCMDLLKAGKIDEAISALYEYDDSTEQVSPLSKETELRYRRIFTLFPVKEYKMEYYSFQLKGLNDVKYSVKFAEMENPAETGEAITSYMFNPVKIDDVWYITVKRADQSIDETHI